jgi:hypothetical protein
VVRGDVAVDEQRRTAMLDLLDKVPQEQRTDSFVAALEQLSPISKTILNSDVSIASRFAM